MYFQRFSQLDPIRDDPGDCVAELTARSGHLVGSEVT
jgi:hypothetical protein